MKNTNASQPALSKDARLNKSFRIPFNKPYCAGNELKNIAEVLSLGHISGDGSFTAACSALLEQFFVNSKVFLTTSCTHALEMSALLIDLKPGDEVIVPSFTFVSTVNAFALRGAIPRFVDIRPDTLNLDESKLPALINDRTRAIVPVHYAGVACEMDEIGRLAQLHGLKVVEDNAHGFGGFYKGRALGSFGEMATLSFHETKNISCGEGGALVVNSTEYRERAEVIREKGTNRAKFFRGQVDKYSWVDIGSSYLPSDMLAAFLHAQLESRVNIQEIRKLLWNTYHQALQSWAYDNAVQLPQVPDYCEQAFHMYYLLMPNLETRQNFIQYLKNLGILAVYHYVPLHCSEMGIKYGGVVTDCPVTNDISERLVRLPFFNGMTSLAQHEVIDAILKFRCGL